MQDTPARYDFAPRCGRAAFASRPLLRGIDDQGRRASKTRARMRSRREFAAAWLVGGAVWLAGLCGLALAQNLSVGEIPGAATTARTSYYLPDNSYTPVQDISGRYTVVIRTLRKVGSR